MAGPIPGPPSGRTFKSVPARLAAVGGAVFCLVPALADPAQAAAQIEIIKFDQPNVGLNDPTPASPVPGNNGRTLGELRTNAVRAAADAWQNVITSKVPIRVQVMMDTLPCTEDRGTLAGASALSLYRDFQNAPKASTWYPVALANGLYGADLDPNADDIGIAINIAVDTDPNCLGGRGWWYGIGVEAPRGQSSLYSTLLHELAHGLGFATYVDRESGAKFFPADADGNQLSPPMDDIFMTFLNDLGKRRGWPVMTDAERVSSSINTGNLVWSGKTVKECANGFLSKGAVDGGVLMFAPNPFQPGSSVSHFDTELEPDELMEPSATPTVDQRLTDRLLSDIGWKVALEPCHTQDGGGGAGGPPGVKPDEPDRPDGSMPGHGPDGPARL